MGNHDLWWTDKFYDCSFSRFGSIVRIDKQTHRQTRMNALLPRLSSAWAMMSKFIIKCVNTDGLQADTIQKHRQCDSNVWRVALYSSLYRSHYFSNRFHSAEIRCDVLALIGNALAMTFFARAHYTLCLKNVHLLFLITPAKTHHIFWNFWYVTYTGNSTPEGYKFAHLNCILWPHYLQKCERVIFQQCCSYVLPNI